MDSFHAEQSKSTAYRAAVTVRVPVALQQHERWLRADGPGAGLFEVALHGGEAVGAGVGEEGDVAHFVVGEEVRCRGQVRPSLRLIGIDGEVERNGIVLPRYGILGIELHKPVAHLVIGHIQSWCTVHPEIVVSRYGVENFRFRLLTHRCEP